MRKDNPATDCVENTQDENHLVLQFEPLLKESLDPIMFDYDELADVMWQRPPNLCMEGVLLQKYRKDSLIKSSSLSGCDE